MAIYRVEVDDKVAAEFVALFNCRVVDELDPDATIAEVTESDVPITAHFIVDYIAFRPGCVKTLYPEGDHHLIDESQLLDPNDWHDTTEDGDGCIFWENENGTWGDGIRFCYEDGEVTLEEL